MGSQGTPEVNLDLWHGTMIKPFHTDYTLILLKGCLCKGIPRKLPFVEDASLNLRCSNPAVLVCYAFPLSVTIIQ